MVLIGDSQATVVRSLSRPIWPLLCILVIAVVVQISLVDRSWYPPDDGAYASVAARIVGGEVLNRDVQDVHAGYINFLNAGALIAFGDSLLSLRYPLVLMGVASTLLAWGILLPLGVIPAMAGSLAVACLSVVQFPNPTPHWYCVPLFLALLLCFRSPLTRRSLMSIGMLVGLAFCLRQLTGAIVSVAVLLLLAAQAPDPQKASRLPTQILLILGAGLLTVYLLGRTDLFSFLIFGVPTILCLILVTARTAVDYRALAHRCGWILVGVFAAIAPLVAYHQWHGSMGTWLDHIVLDAFSLSGQAFVRNVSYRSFAQDALQGLLGGGEPTTVMNAFMWLVLVMIPMVLGIGSVLLLLRDRAESVRVRICVGASVYGLVAVHYQIPVYLWYTAAISLVGLAALAAPSRVGQWVVLVLVVAVASTALYGQAAQPLDRGLGGILAGQREKTWKECNLPRLGIRIPERDCKIYGELLQRIDALTRPGSAIFVLPSDAEIYYLSRRRNPFQFFNSALGIRSESDLQNTIETLQREEPPVVIWRDGDKYETTEARRILAYVEHAYLLDSRIGPFRVFAMSAVVSTKP